MLKRSLSNKYFYVFLGGAALVAGLISFLIINNLLSPHQEDKASIEAEETEENMKNDSEISLEDEEFLTLPSQRAIAVVIDNAVEARPQAGLEKADLVYEFPVEGGITRFMTVFYRLSAQDLGPIRSARDYIIDLAKEHDAIFVHAGGSPVAYSRFKEVDNLNGLAGGVDRAFWRIGEKKKPHNLYSNTETIRRVAKQETFSEIGKNQEFKYLSSENTFEGKNIKGLSIPYSSIKYKAAYKYDENLESYLRITGETEHLTPQGEQIYVKNIIVQIVKGKVIDKEGRLSLNLKDKNTAYYFSQGKMLKGYWTKESGQTKFYKENEQEIELAPGRTWLNIVPQNREKELEFIEY